MPPKQAPCKAKPTNPKPRKRKPPPSPSVPTPSWDIGLTSLASRERKRFKLSRLSLHEELNPDYITSEATKLTDESAYSWGTVLSSPIQGSRRPKARSRGLVKVKRERGGDTGVEDAYLSMFNAMVPRQHEPIENELSRTPILRVPLEVRERIYSYLLLYPAPVMVKDDWRSMERNPIVKYSLMLVCKQFAFEATSFVYRQNTFRALIREPAAKSLRFEPPAKLPLVALSLLRNIVVDCSKNCWNLEWHEKIAKGLNALADRKPCLETVTLVVVPQRVGMSHTAVGIQGNPLTFADFFYHSGPFMRALRKLAPRWLKVVIKKPRKVKLGIQVDLTYLRIGAGEDGVVAGGNGETLKIRGMRRMALKKELNGLKGRFEDIFEDTEGALAEGLCELISAGERGKDENEMEGGEGEGRDGHGDDKDGRAERERIPSEEFWVF